MLGLRWLDRYSLGRRYLGPWPLHESPLPEEGRGPDGPLEVRRGDVSIDWVHDRVSPRTFVKGGGVPEGIFYPCQEGISPRDRDEWRRWKDEALTAGEESWRIIGERRVFLVNRTGTVHALRCFARGHGKRKREWERTTECGILFSRLPARQDKLRMPLAATTCLSCRKVVRERYERDLTWGDPLADAGMDEYDRLHDENEEMWRIQAEWHKPDPITMWPIPVALNYSLVGG